MVFVPLLAPTQWPLPQAAAVVQNGAQTRVRWSHQVPAGQFASPMQASYLPSGWGPSGTQPRAPVASSTMVQRAPAPQSWVSWRTWHVFGPLPPVPVLLVLPLGPAPVTTLVDPPVAVLELDPLPLALVALVALAPPVPAPPAPVSPLG
jgi:hypothetical protein